MYVASIVMAVAFATASGDGKDDCAPVVTHATAAASASPAASTSAPASASLPASAPLEPESVCEQALPAATATTAAPIRPTQHAARAPITRAFYSANRARRTRTRTRRAGGSDASR